MIIVLCTDYCYISLWIFLLTPQSNPVKLLLISFPFDRWGYWDTKRRHSWFCMFINWQGRELNKDEFDANSVHWASILYFLPQRFLKIWTDHPRVAFNYHLPGSCLPQAISPSSTDCHSQVTWFLSQVGSLSPFTWAGTSWLFPQIPVLVKENPSFTLYVSFFFLLANWCFDHASPLLENKMWKHVLYQTEVQFLYKTFNIVHSLTLTHLSRLIPSKSQRYCLSSTQAEGSSHSQRASLSLLSCLFLFLWQIWFFFPHDLTVSEGEI